MAWKGKLYQFFTAFVLGIGSLCMGLLFVWPSYTLPMLAASNNTILSAPLTEAEEALLGSLPSLGAMVGSTCVAVLIEFFGRKRASLLITLIFIISWIMVNFTRSIVVILVARFVGGFAGGATDCIGPIFVSEIADDSIRGGLVLVLLLMYSLGMVVSYFIGWYCDYYAIGYINMAIAIFRLILLLGIPESPVFFMKKNRVEDARKVISILRSVAISSTVVDQEISKIRQQIYAPVPLSPLPSDDKEGDEEKTLPIESEDYKYEPTARFAALKTLCKSPVSRKAFFLVFMSFTFQIIMGNLPVSVYAKQVFDEYDPSTGDMCSVIFAVVWCSGVLLSSAITDKVGRRAMLLTSSIMVAISLIILAVFFQTKVAPPWATVLVIMIYCFCYLFGAGAIPFVLMSELFCREVQTLGSTLIILWVWLATFLILAIFNALIKVIGIHGTFYIFAFNSLLNAIFSYFLIPETKGMSNKQIQLALLKGRRQ